TIITTIPPTYIYTLSLHDALPIFTKYFSFAFIIKSSPEECPVNIIYEYLKTNVKKSSPNPRMSRTAPILLFLIENFGFFNLILRFAIITHYLYIIVLKAHSIFFGLIVNAFI